MHPAIFLLIAMGLLLGYSETDAIQDTVTTMSDDFTRYDDLFKKYGTLRNVPWKWIKAIAWVESDLGRDSSVKLGISDPGNPASVSRDGQSYGILQLTIPTANRPRVRPGTTREDLNNPEICIDCGARYLAELSRYYFPGDREGVIRGYNGGPGWRNASQNSLDQTAEYYQNFINKLDVILTKQGSDETKRG